METVLKDRDAMVALYAPYCEGYDQPQLLDQALETLGNKILHGSRRLKPEGSHPFELTWEPGESPQEPSSCELSFPLVEAVTYRFSVPTAQLVLWLMDILAPQTIQVTAPALPSILFPMPPLPAPGLGLQAPGGAAPGAPAPALPPLPFAPLGKPPSPMTKAPAAVAGPLDLPDSFWRWLLVGDVPAGHSA